MTKEDKQRKKEILMELKRKQQEEFEQGLPMKSAAFESLFSYLDDQLESNDCDDTLKWTIAFLEKNKIDNIEDILKWLADNGGYCDCEILANIEELF